jgi:hypothetical protein
MAMAHPERLESLIVQNALTHDTGFGDLWAAGRAFGTDHASHETAFRQTLLSHEAAHRRDIGGDPSSGSYMRDNEGSPERSRGIAASQSPASR